MNGLDFHRLELSQPVLYGLMKVKLNLFLKKHNFKNVTPIHTKIHEGTRAYTHISALCFQDKTEAMRFKLMWTSRDEELK